MWPLHIGSVPKMNLRRQTLRDLAASAYRLLTGFHGGNHGLSKLFGACLAANIARSLLALGVDVLNGRVHTIRRIGFVYVTQHEHRRLHHRSWVSQTFSGNVWR